MMEKIIVFVLFIVCLGAIWYFWHYRPNQKILTAEPQYTYKPEPAFLAGILAVIAGILVRIYPDIALLAVIADVAFWGFICAIGNFYYRKFFRRWGYVIFLITAGGTVIVHLLNW